MELTWKDVPGFNGRYQVNKNGEVRSIDWFEKQYGKRSARILPGKILKKKINNKGYPYLILSGKKTVTIHKLVMETFVGPKPYGHEINHINSNPLDSRLENLEYVTHKQNMEHCSKSGRMKKNSARGKLRYSGTCNPKAKLTEDEVKFIKCICFKRGQKSFIAKIFGVSFSTISSLSLGRSWATTV